MAARNTPGRPGLAILGVLLAIACLAGASWRFASAGEDVAFGSPRLDMAVSPQTVPLRRVGGHVLVDVTVGPGGPVVPMLVDTGAPTMISAELAARIGASPAGRLAIASVSGRQVLARTVHVGEMRIGDSAFRDVTAVVGAVTSDSPLADLAGHGVIGASLMRAGVWQLDLGAGSLTIAPSVAGLDHVAGAIVLDIRPASRDSPSPIVSLGIDGATRSFLLDTGSDGGLIVHPAMLAEARPPVRPTATSMATWDGWLETHTSTARADVSLGSLMLLDHPMVTSDVLGPGIGNIGNGFLRGFILTLDWLAGRAYLEPRPVAHHGPVDSLRRDGPVSPVTILSLPLR